MRYLIHSLTFVRESGRHTVSFDAISFYSDNVEAVKERLLSVTGAKEIHATYSEVSHD